MNSIWFPIQRDDQFENLVTCIWLQGHLKLHSSAKMFEKPNDLQLVASTSIGSSHNNLEFDSDVSRV